jgi:hypothetical protein
MPVFTNDSAYTVLPPSRIARTSFPACPSRHHRGNASSRPLGDPAFQDTMILDRSGAGQNQERSGLSKVSCLDGAPCQGFRRGFANGAGLHRHQATRELGKESDKPPARELARHDHLALRVDSVNLKDLLRRMRPTRVTAAIFQIDLHMDGFPSDGVSTTTILAR